MFASSSGSVARVRSVTPMSAPSSSSRRAAAADSGAGLSMSLPRSSASDCEALGHLPVGPADIARALAHQDHGKRLGIVGQARKREWRRRVVVVVGAAASPRPSGLLLGQAPQELLKKGCRRILAPLPGGGVAGSVAGGGRRERVADRDCGGRGRARQ
eukprot:scaffold12679_cov106-Isochrysis_galbana.AAC.7